MEYRARCHCGRVKFSFRSPAITTAARCDCSLCVRRAAWLSSGYIPAADFTPHANPDDLGCYLWNEKVLRNGFCKTLRDIHLHRRRRERQGRLSRQPRLRRRPRRLRLGGDADRRQVGPAGRPLKKKRPRKAVFPLCECGGVRPRLLSGDARTSRGRRARSRTAAAPPGSVRSRRRSRSSRQYRSACRRPGRWSWRR